MHLSPLRPQPLLRDHTELPCELNELSFIKYVVNPSDEPHPFFSTVLSFFSALNTNWLYISAINIDLQIRMLCAKLNRPNGFREEMWKVYKGMDRLTDGQTDKHTDDGQNEIRETLFSFQLRWSNLLIKLEFTFKLKTV